MPTELSELVVNGESYSYADGKLTIAPPEGAVLASQFAADLLSRLGIPGLRYDILNSTVTVDNEQPVILVNGVISSMNRLRTIKASDVLSVQFTREVPLIYRNQGNSLIDVRVRHIAEGGSVAVRAEADVVGSMQDGRLAATYNRGASQWVVEYEMSHRNNYKVDDSYISRYTAPEMQVELSSETASPFKYTFHSPVLNYLYNPSQSFILQARLSLNAYRSHRHTYGESHDSMLGNYDLSTESRDHTLSPTLDLYLQKSFGSRSTLQANVTGTMGNTDYRILSDYSYSAPQTPVTYDNATRSRRRSLLTNVAYTYTPTGSLSLELDYENVVARTVNSYNASPAKQATTEVNNYLYAQASKGFRKFRMSATTGVRLDHLNERGNKNTHVHNTSNLRLFYNFTPHVGMTLLAGYRPMGLPLNLLVQQEQQISPYQVTTGNPTLRKPQRWNLMWSMGVHTGKVTLTPQIFYARTHNTILTTYDYDTSRRVFVSMPRNMRFTDALAGQLQVVANEVVGMFNFSGSLMLIRSTTNDGTGWTLAKNTVDADINIDWYYRKWAVNLYHKIPGNWLTGYTFDRGDAMSQLMVMWSPDSHWRVWGRWMYMFQPRGWTQDNTVDAPHYYSSTSRSIRTNSNGVEIGLTYFCQFGDIFNRKGRDRTINNRDTQTTVTKYE